MVEDKLHQLEDCQGKELVECQELMDRGLRVEVECLKVCLRLVCQQEWEAWANHQWEVNKDNNLVLEACQQV